MVLEKVYEELMELYDSSGREFFSEAVTLLANWFTGREHTILARDGDDGWKLAASTLQDPDETGFLVKAAEREFNDCGRRFCFFSEMRNGVSSHKVIPLMIRKKEAAAGLWIMESDGKEKNNLDKELLKTGHLLAFFVQHSLDERMLVHNRYLDVGTNLPGRAYFGQVAKRIQEQGHQILLCGFRRNGFREAVRVKGMEKMQEELLRLCNKIKALGLGNVYFLAEDTVAMISPENKQEVYAALDCVLRDYGKEKTLKIVMLYLARGKDMLTEMEEAFSMGKAGDIWLHLGEKKPVPCGSEPQKPEPEEAQESSGKISGEIAGESEDVVEEGCIEEVGDILELLEGRRNQ